MPENVASRVAKIHFPNTTHKKGTNNETIAMTSHAIKVLLKIIQNKIVRHMDIELSVEQAGFKKGRGTRNQIANLRWIMEKLYEYGNMYMYFIDYKKALDCANHSQLCNTLRRMGIPGNITILIKNLYEGHGTNPLWRDRVVKSK